MADKLILTRAERRNCREIRREKQRGAKKQEIELAEQFAKSLVKPFRPDQFHDEYSKRVEQLIESKNKGKPAPRTEKAQRLAPVVDIMSTLKKILAAKGKPAAASTKKRSVESA